MNAFVKHFKSQLLGFSQLLGIKGETLLGTHKNANANLIKAVWETPYFSAFSALTYPYKLLPSRLLRVKEID